MLHNTARCHAGRIAGGVSEPVPQNRSAYRSGTPSSTDLPQIRSPAMDLELAARPFQPLRVSWTSSSSCNRGSSCNPSELIPNARDRLDQMDGLDQVLEEIIHPSLQSRSQTRSHNYAWQHRIRCRHLPSPSPRNEPSFSDRVAGWIIEWTSHQRGRSEPPPPTSLTT